MKTFLKFWFYLFNWNRVHDNFVLTPYEKRDRIQYFSDKFQARNFVETGSYHGDTSKYIAAHVEHVVTIEIDPANAEIATANCRSYDNVDVHCGPSEDILPKILPDLDGRTLFWLDAHYQTGMLRGRSDCPLFRELDVIFDQAQIEPLILIDDARKFIWINGWPSLSSIRRVAQQRGFDFRVSDDMICLGRFSM